MTSRGQIRGSRTSRNTTFGKGLAIRPTPGPLPFPLSFIQFNQKEMIPCRKWFAGRNPEPERGRTLKPLSLQSILDARFFRAASLQTTGAWCSEVSGPLPSNSEPGTASRSMPSLAATRCPCTPPTPAYPSRTWIFLLATSAQPTSTGCLVRVPMRAVAPSQKSLQPSSLNPTLSRTFHTSHQRVRSPCNFSDISKPQSWFDPHPSPWAHE
jgi:hypothetical protein